MGISIAKHKRALASAAMAVVLVAGLAVPTTVALAEPTAAEKQAEAQQALNKLNEMRKSSMRLRIITTRLSMSRMPPKKRWRKLRKR